MLYLSFPRKMDIHLMYEGIIFFWLQAEFSGFTEWLQTFDLYRGKQGEEEMFEDDSRVVGKFKVREHYARSTKGKTLKL